MLSDTATEPSPSIRSFSGLLADRFAGQPAWAAVTEVFIGLGWLRAATSKLIDGNWWSGEELVGFLDEHRASTLGWYAPFVDLVVEPHVALVALVVLVLQLVVAASLLAGRGRSLGLGVGISMNLHFVAAGAVNPSAFYLLAQGALVLWMIDHWSSSRAHTRLPGVAAAGLAVAGFNLPFIATLHPAEVIDDPAIMFCTLGVLTCLAATLAVATADELEMGRLEMGRSDERQPESDPSTAE